MEPKVNLNAVVTCADFWRICHVDDRQDFSGFEVRPEGLYVILPPDDCNLSPSEFAAIYWHPTGHYDQPALALPCTVAQLVAFDKEAGLGCIDEEELPVVTEQVPLSPVKPISRSDASDALVIAELKAQGFDPLALPKNAPGKPGVPAQIRKSLIDKRAIQSIYVFEHAWERLAKDQKIKYKN